MAPASQIERALQFAQTLLFYAMFMFDFFLHSKAFAWAHGWHRTSRTSTGGGDLREMSKIPQFLNQNQTVEAQTRCLGTA